MSDHIVVIGAGAGGLAAAIRLAAKGHAVTVLERQHGAGGKMRPETLGGETYDTGPTVLTMKWVFDELFAAAGKSLDDHVALEPLDILARHFWSGEQKLDLHADPVIRTDAINRFAGKPTRYADFARDSQRIYDTLRDTFMRRQRPTPFSLAASMPLMQLMGINPLETLWHALGRYFDDPRLIQLFGRYATYCGSSPFKSPATLMLVAAVEAQGVWRAKGGMAVVAQALESVARNLGVRFFFNRDVRIIEAANGAITAVIDQTGQRHACTNVVLNADSEAAAEGLFGHSVASIASRPTQDQKSLSAITWCLRAKSSGSDLDHHNVFFSDDCTAEFDALQSTAAQDPTVYLCQQGDDRKLILINAPANAASAPDEAVANMLRRVARCGVKLEWPASTPLCRDPRIFSELYPATSGALYGRSAHGWTAAFQRPQARTKIPGLYLAGGYTHPGPGVPMAVLSGQLAAEALISDRASMRPFRKTATAGGMSMH